MRLYDIAKIVRSKNAGPFNLTVDLIFDDEKKYETVLKAASFNPVVIAGLYGVDADDVRIYPFKRILAVKVTMPRPISSGAPGDTDVYGSQQHFPLAGMDIV